MVSHILPLSRNKLMRFNAGEHFMIAPANHSGPQEKIFSSVKHTSLLQLANNLLQ
jgi:hypothetical protein